MDARFEVRGEARPERFLAALYGVIAMVLGGGTWSAIGALFGPWSLLAAPGPGWLVGWACRHGARRMDTLIRVIAWLESLAAVLAGLLALSAFTVIQSSPDSGLSLGAVGSGCLRMFSEPPWLGAAAVLLGMIGTWHSLREADARRGRTQAPGPVGDVPRIDRVAGRPPARPTRRESDSQAA
jgi:hypothetical protein